MKNLSLIAILFAFGTANAQTYVKPHVRKDGTYVQGHYRSDSNDTKVDNYSSQGNYNPYTGAKGTEDPYRPKTCRVTSAGKYVCE